MRSQFTSKTNQTHLINAYFYCSFFIYFLVVLYLSATPCPELNIPLNGARICNGWKRDFGQYCIIACQSGFTIDPDQYKYETMYVCGASGVWIASAPAPDCSSKYRVGIYVLSKLHPPHRQVSFARLFFNPLNAG